MDLHFTTRDHKNTVIELQPGQPLYHIDTPISFLGNDPTSIYLVPENRAHIGQIEFRSFHDDVVTLRGQNLDCVRSGTFSNSEIFQGSDQRQYKWKVSGSNFTLEHDHRPVASFNLGSRGILSGIPKKPCLHITNEVAHIQEEVVITAIYVRLKVERARKRRRAAH
ncbi:hypothetical protein DL96DRAFT_184106 [Flagelloscypha sp. PMI_526]|nr:hypothetical protein DL96DRAFT_184106 [Flagelloscypha sp. PMI_526]